MRSILTEEHVRFYQKNGFVHIENALTEEEIDELAQYMEEAMYNATHDEKSLATSAKDGAYYRVLNQKVNTWRDHAGICKYSFHPRLAEMARRLAGVKAIRFFHDHALWKMPGDSKETPWHQDFPYWPMNEPGALSVWIPMEDVDETNGCMVFVPQSFKAGKLKAISLTNPDNLFQHAQEAGIDIEEPSIVRLKKGSCTFHHGLNFHYAYPNQTNTPRRTLAIIYMPDGTTYNGKPHPVTNGQGLVENKPIQGPLFPILNQVDDSK